MGAHILVVEDEPIVCKDLCLLIEKKIPEVMVVGVHGFKEATQALGQVPFDLALLDIRLGSSNSGIELAEMIQKENSQMPVIFVTGNTSEDMLDKMTQLRPANIVAKPFNPVQIEAVIVKALKERRRPLLPSLNTKLGERPASILGEERNKLRFFEDVLNQMSLISATDAKGKIILANSKFCEISGYEEQELIGQDHRILNSGYHDKKFWKEMYETMVSGKVFSAVIKNRKKDGSFYWVKSYCAAYFDQHRFLKNFFSIRFDITNDKQRIEYLQMRDDYIKNIINEEFISSFIGGACHHLFNTMMSSQPGMKKIENGLFSQDFKLIRDGHEELKVSCDRIVSVAKDLRKIGDQLNLEDSEFQKIRVDSFVEGLNKTIQECFNLHESKHIKFSIAEKLKGHIWAYGKELVKAIWASVQNAIEFNELQKGLEITITIQTNDKHLIIHVQDNGKGFSADDLRKAFLPFYSTKQDVYGVGLGLTEARRIIRAHKGHIHFGNNEIGALVTYEVPLYRK